VAKDRFNVVGVGELLWDVFPDGAKLGGAPTNFAHHVASLGDAGTIVSRLGDDERGAEARRLIERLGLSGANIQTDEEHRTGTVMVNVDEAGVPDFVITEDVAWDYIAWSDDLARLAASADCVCFGSLAQRGDASRATIERFVDATKPGAVRIFDVNLRQDFFTTEILERSLRRATVVKLNDEELPRVAAALSCGEGPEEDRARSLAKAFELDLVCVTRGAKGCLLVSRDRVASHPGFPCDVADTVGSGDAFTAAMAHHVLRASPLERTCEAANRMGSWVASQSGGTPPADPAIVAAVAGGGA
jgi:fructokinase